MPWPGPHTMLLMEICEEFLTIETQSSPTQTDPNDQHSEKQILDLSRGH